MIPAPAQNKMQSAKLVAITAAATVLVTVVCLSIHSLSPVIIPTMLASIFVIVPVAFYTICMVYFNDGPRKNAAVVPRGSIGDFITNFAAEHGGAVIYKPENIQAALKHQQEAEKIKAQEAYRIRVAEYEAKKLKLDEFEAEIEAREKKHLKTTKCALKTSEYKKQIGRLRAERDARNTLIKNHPSAEEKTSIFEPATPTATAAIVPSTVAPAATAKTTTTPAPESPSEGLVTLWQIINTLPESQKHDMLISLYQRFADEQVTEKRVALQQALYKAANVPEVQVAEKPATNVKFE